MSILSILIYPDPILKKKSELVDFPDTGLEELTQNMLETMYAYGGVGLAAPQVGILKRIFVMDIEDGSSPMVFINPVLTKPIDNEDIPMDEGCLSFPGYRESIKRAATVAVYAADTKGNYSVTELNGLAAQCAQHEIEHLDGIVLTDNLSRSTRRFITSDLRKRKKKKNLRYVQYE